MCALWPSYSACGGYITPPPDKAQASRWPRRVMVMGSTGSIGRNALAVAGASGGQLQICGLACATNIRELADQARRWQPPVLGVLKQELIDPLAALLPGSYHPEIVAGPRGYARMASLPEADWVLCGQVGIAGLATAFAAACAGKVIALANKESLVSAGAAMRKLCRTHHASVLPVDSEHYAIFQCLAGRADIKHLILTASGGPFLGKSLKDIQGATPEDALKHPNWTMGAKISIDSASLMNKGLEFLEAMHLYGLNAEKIEILIQPQSIIHSLVEFTDNSLLAQLAVPDMRLPIAACLFWPRMAPPVVPPLDLLKASPLTFVEPDKETFACLDLALAIAGKLDIADEEMSCGPLVLNAANEAAVELFLNRKCFFGQMPEIIARALSEFSHLPALRLPDTCGDAAPLAEEIAAIDQEVKAAIFRGITA